MFLRRRSRFLILSLICSLIVTWLVLPTQAHPGNAQSRQRSAPMPQSLESEVQAALGPDHRPMQIPTAQQAQLLASDMAGYNQFGKAVALSSDGNTALVGAPYKNAAGVSYGTAYVYIRSGNVWTQQAILIANDRGQDDVFGDSVALSNDGNLAMIGASYKSDNPTTHNGAVYVFTRSGGVWTQQAKLLASDKANNDYFGADVALNADASTALISAAFKSESGLTFNGATYVFTRSGNVWTQQAKLLASDKATGDRFGTSLALSSDGNSALIGALNSSDGGVTQNGATYVFARTGNVWTQQIKLLASDKANYDSFGYSVALSSDGNTALIGAKAESDSGTVFNGATYVFTRTGNVWTQQTKLLASDKAANDAFGTSVALSSDGTIALISAQFESDSGTMYNGAVYIFTYAGSVWTQQTKFLANDKADYNALGDAIALSSDGNTAIVGASSKSIGDMTAIGAAYVFSNISLPPTATPVGTSTPTTTPLPPHPDTIGVYNNGVFYLRNANLAGSADITAPFGGDVSDLPVAGDWDGDSVDTIGIYRSSSGFFYLSNSNTAPAVNYTVLFGNPADTPFAGRWTADMTGDGIGVYRNSNGILYQRKSLTSGFDDFFAVFGNPGDQGVAGDWDGNGFDSIGVYRSSNHTWYLTNNSAPAGITFAGVNFVFDIGSGIPVVGDWKGDHSTRIGYYTNASVFMLRNINSASGYDSFVVFGPAGGKPIAGKWIAASRPPMSGVVGGIKPGSNASDQIGGNAD